MRAFAGLLIFAFLWPSWGMAAQTGSVIFSVDLRSGPGTHFRAKARAKAGDRVEILEEVEGWLNVQLSDGAEGWAPKSAVQIDGGEGSTKAGQPVRRPGGSLSFDMALIPAGEFPMGSDEGDTDERPVHRIVLDAYAIDRYEVTNGQYEAFMEATGHRRPLYWGDARFSGSDRPVIGVSWDDADAYCRWAEKRLPTEAEWEKAARGVEGETYPWGDTFDGKRLNWRGHADYARDPDPHIDGYAFTAPAGSYPTGASSYGVHDMLGNVWEWCADWYDEGFYKQSPPRNPKGPPDGRSRVLRGGAWIDYRSSVRSANRMRAFPSLRHMDIGFRCAKTP